MRRYIAALIFTAGLSFVSTVNAAFTLSWTPGEEVPGAAVSEWLVWCIPAFKTDGITPRDYGAPNRLPESTREYVFAWAEDGEWKCKVEAYSSESGEQSAEAESIYFTVKDRSVYYPPDPEIPRPNLPTLVIQ